MRAEATVEPYRRFRARNGSVPDRSRIGPGADPDQTRSAAISTYWNEPSL